MKRVILSILLLTLGVCQPYPDGFRRMPIESCSTTRYYRFHEEQDSVQLNRQQKQAKCSDQAASYSGTGGLIHFVSGDEFNRVKLILQALQPSSPYLTSLRYIFLGGDAGYQLQFMTASAGNLDVGEILNSEIDNFPIFTEDPTYNLKCVGMGMVEGSIDLVIMECDNPSAFICDLELTVVPSPNLIGNSAVDGSLTLSCGYSSSSAIRSVVWLRNGQDITAQLTSGYNITTDPGSSEVGTSTLQIFDRSTTVASYQCMLVGALASTTSNRVTVLSAIAPEIKHAPMSAAFAPGTIGFFSCFPKLTSLPHPAVTWYKNGTPLDPSDQTKYFINPRTCRLFISDVQPSDVGTYRCQLTNSKGTVTSAGGVLSLNSTEDLAAGYRLTPGFDTDPIRVLKSVPLVVDAVASSSHNRVNYQWIYPVEGPTLVLGFGYTQVLGYRNSGNELVQPSYFGNLLLNAPSVGNSGVFSVQIALTGNPFEVPSNAETVRANVSVESAPSSSLGMQSLIGTLGQKIVITCSVFGNPIPRREWYRSGIRLMNDIDYEIAGSHLNIMSLQVRDLTSFQCLAVSDRGTAVSQIHICGRNGIPGPVVLIVEPLSNTSVRIRWDPPSNPNDDIELLSYDVYYDLRSIGESAAGINTERTPLTLPWNNRSVEVDQLGFSTAVVALVVAASPMGRRSVPGGEETTVGYTFGEVASTAPDMVNVIRLDSSSVNVTWNPVTSSRMVDHDVTFYQIEYTLCSTAGLAEPVVVGTSNNDPRYVLGIAEEPSTQRVVVVRVLAVTQVRREPDGFEYGPQSEVASEGGASCPLVLAPNCPAEVDAEWGIQWNETLASGLAELGCQEIAGEIFVIGLINRRCGNDGQWRMVDTSLCQSQTISEIANEISLLETLQRSLSIPEQQMVHDLTVDLVNATSPNTNVLFPADLQSVNTYVDNIATLVESGRTPSSGIVNVTAILEVASNVLEPRFQNSWTSLNNVSAANGAPKLLLNVERVASVLSSSVNFSAQENASLIQLPNLVVDVIVVDTTNVTEDGVAIKHKQLGDSSLTPAEIPAVTLPRQVLQDLGTRVPITTVVFKHLDAIMPRREESGFVFSNTQQQPGTRVVSIQIGSVSAFTPRPISSPITLQFPIILQDAINPICVFWSFNDTVDFIEDGWSSQGLTVKSFDSNTVECQSTHLTSFAVLMDVSGQLPPSLPLSILTYIGCGISILCLLLTIIFILTMKKDVYLKVNNFVLLNLCIALMCGLIIFCAGIETATWHVAPCSVVAALLHYFFLAAFGWMLCESVLIYNLLVKVFGAHQRKWLYIYMAIGWGFPIPILIISLASRYNFYYIRGSLDAENYYYNTITACWLSSQEGVIFAFVVPMVAILIINTCLLIRALVSLWRSNLGASAQQIGEKETKESRKTAIKLFKATVILMPVLGLTWLFGLLAAIPFPQPGQLILASLFLILNTLQGAAIFFFHVIRHDRIWPKLKRMLCSCLKSSKDYTDPALLPKTAKGTLSASNLSSGYSSKSSLAKGDGYVSSHSTFNPSHYNSSITDSTVPTAQVYSINVVQEEDECLALENITTSITGDIVAESPK